MNFFLIPNGGFNDQTLLQVLEYLVMREILTSEHINGGPPCPGMERLEIVMLNFKQSFPSHYADSGEPCGSLNLLRCANEDFSFFMMSTFSLPFKVFNKGRSS